MGKAKTYSLRSYEVAIPMTLISQLVAQSQHLPSILREVIDQQLASWLDSVLPLVTHIGAKKKQRGLGEVAINLVPEKKESKMKHYFTLTAQDALVLSQNNASTGAHQTLDYIPGSAVLGALAGIDYPNDEELAWSLFHSGEVVFSNCYPIIDGQPGLPTPFSWHYKKKGMQILNILMPG
ncbi:hypothetical protein QW180_30930 [Vibrio sinaloensis]|nr:hypothetical protein [Vibrio sinaloensis]